MNIHVDDDKLKKQLFDSELIRIPFGSHVYGLSNENSDEDYICIYAEHITEHSSFLWEHHNFQIKDNNVDYVFTSLRNFIRNLVNGDMPGNLESIHLNELEHGYFSFLYHTRQEFHSYTNIRSFLGYAKRDLKHALRDDSRLCHAYRSIISAKKVLDHDYTVDCRGWDEYQDLLDIKNGLWEHHQKKDLCNELTEQCSILRGTINGKLEKGEITRFLDTKYMAKLDRWLLTVMKSQWYNEHANTELANMFKYDILENGIKY